MEHSPPQEGPANSSLHARPRFMRAGWATRSPLCPQLPEWPLVPRRGSESINRGESRAVSSEGHARSGVQGESTVSGCVGATYVDFCPHPMTSEEEECSASETRDSLPPGITSAPTSMLCLEDDCGAGTQHCPTANRPAMGEDRPPRLGSSSVTLGKSLLSPNLYSCLNQAPNGPRTCDLSSPLIQEALQSSGKLRQCVLDKSAPQGSFTRRMFGFLMLDTLPTI